MAKDKNLNTAKEPGKAELQRRMEETRESISETVAEIKETVEDQYASVKDTISGVAEWRDQFQKEPLVWSLGALTAGFALGYTLGYAHKTARTGNKKSEIAAFADSIVDELSKVGGSLIMPTLNNNIKQLFGFDFSDLLEEVGDLRKTSRKRKPAVKRSMKKTAVKKTASKKSRAKKS